MSQFTMQLQALARKLEKADINTRAESAESPQLELSEQISDDKERAAADEISRAFRDALNRPPDPCEGEKGLVLEWR